MSIIYLHAKNLGFTSKIELGNIIITFAHFSFSRNFYFVKFISPICFISQLITLLYGLIYPLTRFMPKIMKFCRKLRGTGVMAFFYLKNWAGIINITFRHFGFSIRPGKTWKSAGGHVFLALNGPRGSEKCPREPHIFPCYFY